MPPSNENGPYYAYYDQEHNPQWDYPAVWDYFLCGSCGGYPVRIESSGPSTRSARHIDGDRSNQQQRMLTKRNRSFASWMRPRTRSLLLEQAALRKYQRKKERIKQRKRGKDSRATLICIRPFGSSAVTGMKAASRHKKRRRKFFGGKNTATKQKTVTFSDAKQDKAGSSKRRGDTRMKRNKSWRKILLRGDVQEARVAKGRVLQEKKTKQKVDTSEASEASIPSSQETASSRATSEGTSNESSERDSSRMSSLVDDDDSRGAHTFASHSTASSLTASVTHFLSLAGFLRQAGSASFRLTSILKYKPVDLEKAKTPQRLLEEKLIQPTSMNTGPKSEGQQKDAKDANKITVDGSVNASVEVEIQSPHVSSESTQNQNPTVMVDEKEDDIIEVAIQASSNRFESALKKAPPPTAEEMQIEKGKQKTEMVKSNTTGINAIRNEESISRNKTEHGAT